MLAGDMVSATAEAALHPRTGDDGFERHEAQAAAAMGHSLTASRNLMAALSPLEQPEGFEGQAAEQNGGAAAAFEDVNNCGAVRPSCAGSCHERLGEMLS
jgi:hypothetical protein